MVEFLKRDNQADLAYLYDEGHDDLPTVIFLGGFFSNMMGSKASFLAETCQNRNQGYLRFDYTGHGQSGGSFEEGCISDWAQDAADIIDHCIKGSFILVGSSMGGWISLLLARDKPKDIKALVGIAAAPDFTTWMERDMSDAQRQEMENNGVFKLPSDYGAPYPITKRLIEDGRKNVLLDKELDIHVPVCLLQGRKDKDVPWKTVEDIKNIIQNDVEIIYREDGDHSLSSDDDLSVLDDVIKKLSGV